MNPKRYVESEFQRAAAVVDDIAGKSEIALLRGFAAKRRQQAILGCLDRAADEFARLGPAEQLLVTAEVRPMITYNSVNAEDDLTIAAALWILERIRKTNHFYEMTKHLPDLTGDPDTMNLPMDFSHPCYSNELIEAVVYVLKHRYEDGTEVLGESAARGEKPSTAFRMLWSMIPKEDVEKACSVFREKQWELLSRFIRSYTLLSREIERTEEVIDRQIEPPSPLMIRPRESTAEDMRRLAERTEELEETRTRLTVHFTDCLQMERRQMIRQMGSRQIADVLSGFDIADPYEICFAIYALIEKQEDAAWLVSAGSHLCEFARRMLPWYVNSSDWDEDDWDSWFDGMTYDINGWVEDEPPEEEVDFHHTRFRGRTLAQIVYELSRGVVPVGLHPFEKNRTEMIAEGMDERTARKVIDMAELLFLREFQADTYKAYEPFAWETDGTEEGKADPGAAGIAATAPQAGPSPQLPAPGGYWGRTFGIKAAEPDWQAGAAEGKPEDKTEGIRSEELEKAKQEIKALRAALYRERREAGDERAKLEHELKTLRMEHRELADLRTLVFNRESGNPPRLEKIEKRYEYPYRTRKRTVVFGGHDSFLRAFRPMFPDVRFVDADNLAFSPDIIRNSDVVWIQNNCIGHSQYWNIVKTCKLAGVQMRYFGFAGAEKCAEQLVTEDLK